MYAHSLVSGVKLKKDNTYTEANIQKAHLVSIDNEIKMSSELCLLHGMPAKNSMTNGAYLDIEEDVLLEQPSKCRLYELAPNNEKDTLKLISPPKKEQAQKYSLNENCKLCKLYDTGITLDAPYRFIAGMSFLREEIYDKKAGA